MTNNEKKFWDILTNLFVGAEVKGKSGFINLMVAKQSYFKKVKAELLQQIDNTCKDNKDFKDELYDKLYSFFHRYFSQSGSIYYNYTPLFYNIYTKAYNENLSEAKTFSTDHEQVISNKQDTSLFYKTQMLYYVKSDKIFKDLEIEIEKKKYIFDVSNMEGKKANEKKNLVYELKPIENKSLSFNVIYSVKGRVTKIADIIKEAKKSNIEVKEEELKKAFQVFEKQSNVDYFINKDAKRFLTEQLDMWIYQYMFSQEVNFDMERFNQIQDFKKVASKLINFISQFENELVKIWNKPRFAINSNIVVTIDKLKAKGFEIDKLKDHPNFKEQQKEWEELGINQSGGLVENEFLPIDTKYFTEFKDEIESLFESDEFDGLLIKSENYQALNTIQPRFKGKVDLIYIDPPFNTGSDFEYIDKFQDSTWLSLMENRLEIAKEILSKKGSFYLNLDYRADYYGRILLNKLFGEKNFLNNIVWNYGSGGKSDNYYGRKHDSILLYKKDTHIFNIDDVGVERGLAKKNNMKKGVDDDGRHYLSIKSNGKIYKYYEDELVTPNDVWDISHLQQKDPERFSFNTQKPEKLLDRIIKGTSNTHSIVLDYHTGSGTTIAVAHKLQRKWIGIEMGEHFNTFYTNEDGIKATGVLGRMKEIFAGNGNHEPCGISKELQKQNEYNKGGLFKYYELEQYEQILKSTKYKDTPSDYLDSKKNDEIKDCFLFDEKLSQVIIPENDSFRVDLSKLYPNIDLKETIHNLAGQRPKEITDTKVIFEDREYELLEILKPLLVW